MNNLPEPVNRSVEPAAQAIRTPAQDRYPDPFVEPPPSKLRWLLPVMLAGGGPAYATAVIWVTAYNPVLSAAFTAATLCFCMTAWAIQHTRGRQ